MSYTPVNSDATNVAGYTITRLNATSPATTAVTSDQAVAIADSYLGSIGYQAHSDAFALGAATTTSTTFVDVGNGSSTGFSPWTFSVPVAKTYVISVNASAVKTASTSSTVLTFQLLVDGVAQPNNSDQLTWFASNFDQKHVIFSVPVALSAGSHTVKLQWKVSASMTASVDPATEGRHFMVTG
jgi:hypothetical protein